MSVRESFETCTISLQGKFIAMRPLDRRYVGAYGRKIIAKFRPSTTQKSLHSGNDVTFRKFIKEILKEGVYEGLTGSV